MAGVITSGSNAKSLWPGVKSWFGTEYAEHPPEYSKIFKKDTDDKNYVEMVATTSFGLAPIKTEGGAVSYDSMRQFFVNRAYHVEYALGFIITEIAFEDNQYKQLAKQRSRALAFSMRQTKEIVGANVINRFATSGYVGGDGVVLGSASHPLANGSTFSNLIGTAADLSGAALEQAGIDIAGFVNNVGLNISIKPQSLLVHRSNMYEAQRILKSAKEYDTANNAINPLMGEFPKGIQVNHYLTDADAWFVLTDAQDGLTYFQRRALRLSPVENDFDTANAKYKADERYAFTWGDPRTIYCSAGA